MFNNPYGGWGPFIPIYGPGNTDSIASISRQITELEQLKKALKESGDKEKKDKGKQQSPAVVNMMFLMLLLSPITGPVMFKFFEWGQSFILPH